jgi:DNA polymerase III subunit delta
LEAGVLIGFLLRHAFLLQSIVSDQNVSESIKKHRVNWKREKAVTEQANRWTEARLSRAIQILGEAILAIRRNAALADALAIRALWSIALAVSRR